jgi:hypothetical protein
LVAARIKVAGDVSLARDMFQRRGDWEGFTSTGPVLLADADINGHLSLFDAAITGTSMTGAALIAIGINVGGTVSLEHLKASGAVKLSSARIRGSVRIENAKLSPGERFKNRRIAEEEGLKAFEADGAQIAGRLIWKPAEQVLGQVNLERASVGELEDDWTDDRANGYWPSSWLRLNGFTYGGFASYFGFGYGQATVEQRLAWLHSQFNPWGFNTQPYEQLAAVYRQAGQETQARKVAIARRSDLRKYGNLGLYRWTLNWLLDKTIKYGYESWRAGIGLAAVFGIFLVLSVLAQHHHLLVPVGDIPGLQFAPSATQCTRGYPCFYPLGYTIDTVIPLLNVHQADIWGPDGSRPWGEAFVVATWIATGLGWALTTLLVAGYTGLVRRD